MAEKPFFSFSIWNVTCQNDMCLVKTRWYSRVVIPTDDPDNFVIKYDMRLNGFEARSLSHFPDLEMWLGMFWVDGNLQMCDCSGLDRTEFKMKLGDEIWLPDIMIYSSFHMRRLFWLDYLTEFTLIKQNNTEELASL